jgi:hypothetical protein
LIERCEEKKTINSRKGDEGEQAKRREAEERKRGEREREKRK